MTTKKIILPLLFLFCSLGFVAQDFRFSQFNAMPFWLNPALVGGSYDVQAGAIYRSQDKGIDNPYTTYGAFADVAILKKKESNSYFGLGLGFIQDNNKNIQYTSSLAALSLSYHLRITRKNFISVGLQPFFFQKSVNYAALKWGSQYDGTAYDAALPTGEPGTNFSKLTSIDGALGVNYQYISGNPFSVVSSESKLQVGLSMYHLPWAKYSFYNDQEKVYSRFCLNASYSYKPGSSRVGVNPLLFFQKQGPSNEIMFGCNVFYILQEASAQTGYVKGSSVSAGLMYRVGDAIVATALLNYANIAFGLAYDINASSLTTSTKSFGAFELSLRYRVSKMHWHAN